MRDAKEIAVANVAVDPIIKGMCGRKAGTKDDAAMLHDPARPNEQRSNRADVGFGDPAQHLLEPMIIERFDVVIQETEESRRLQLWRRNCSVEEN